MEGQVQGVGFRWWTRSQALRLDLIGSVRNCPDGSVTVVACGDPEKVDRLADLLQTGPDGARVTNVSRHTAEPQSKNSFTIQS